MRISRAVVTVSRSREGSSGMAYVDVVGFGAGEAALFNIEQSVGANGVNERGDVRLVQYLLRAYYGSRAGGLAMDGWGGPATNAWISTFQKDMAALGNKVLVDGRFDRAFGSTSSVSRTVYAIYLLNLHVARHNPAAYAALPTVVAMNPNPRGNPYNQTLFQLIRIRDVVMIKRTDDKFEFIYKDGTVLEAYCTSKSAGLAINNRMIESGDHYVRMPDGSFKNIMKLLDWTQISPSLPSS
ncbi:hypothetical protein J5Y09_08365 [Roseomonas sp. PWR1]|uniref:Peptidoglycan binding-like domain-containing protein n=1 Tax=Roseomonas nitratireducens TaxID=2820810 RepID=A0ABS4ARE6_9PROT|nr:hypothetical protein [Neoroseomonas nitratireducens]MBP0463921.1 hypothetical protein [Neoroseomonas nitratireducens]